MARRSKEQGVTLPEFVLVDEHGSTTASARPIGLVEDPENPGRTGILFSGEADSQAARDQIIGEMTASLPPGEFETFDSASSTRDPNLRARRRSRTYGITNWNRSGWQPIGPVREVNRSSVNTPKNRSSRSTPKNSL